MKKTFLSAYWQNLVMINYEADPLLLTPWLPAYTEPDTFNGKTLVSLVGFYFRNTRVFGMHWPLHTNFEEVNLRFYVKHFTGKEWRRGVVFISEIVPRPVIAHAARILYHEPYTAKPMKHCFVTQGESLQVRYSWKNNGRWSSMEVTADHLLQNLAKDSAEEFIFEHYYGYNKYSENKTIEYAVEHDRWQVHSVKSWHLDFDPGTLYDESLLPIFKNQPHSVLLAAGSEVVIRKPGYIKAKRG